MLKGSTEFSKIILACGFTDIRRGVDGLAAIARLHYDLDTTEAGTLFLFCGRKRDRIKGLLWEGDGYVLVYGEFDGFLTCDAYSAYRNFGKESDAKICGCFMHARRRFVEAFLVAHLKDMSEEQIKEHPSVQALLKILEIYRADEPLKKLNADERPERRQSEVKPLVDAYFDYLRTLDMDDPSYGTKMKDAIKYSLNQ